MAVGVNAAGGEAPGEEAFLLALSDRLRRIDDPREILGEAAAALGSYLGASRAGYAEVDAESGIFSIDRDWTDGTVKPGTGHRTMVSFGAETTAMLYRGETQRIDDARTDARVRAQDRAAFEEMRIEAAITVPLVKDGRLVAMLSVQKSVPRVWRDAEVQLVERVAERTWAAHERAKAAARLRDSETTLAFLLALTDRTRGEPDPEAILASTAEMIGRRLQVARVTYGELDATETSITVAHAWADGLATSGATYPLAALGPTLLAEHLSGRTVRVDDVSADDRFSAGESTRLAELSFCSAITVPLTKGGKLRALLSVQDERPRRWTDVELRLVEEVAERTWASLERARTAARLAEREATAAFLLELGDRMRGHATAADILRDAVESVGRRLRAHRVGYAEVNVAAGVFTVEFEWTGGALVSEAARYPLSALGAPMVEVLAGGETMRIDDTYRHPHVDETGRSNLDLIDTRAAIVVPLVRRGEFVAFMSVQHATPWAWSDGEVRLVQEVAERTWATVERASAEAALRDSQALLAAFMENAPVGMYLKDEAGRYVMANAGMDRIFGRPSAEVIGRTADDLFGTDLREKIAQQDAVAQAQGRAQVAEQHLPNTQDGSWTMVIRFPVDLGSQGKRIGGFAIDVTEQKQSEARLAESERRFRAITEAHPVAVTIVRPYSGEVLVANAAFYAMVGKAEGDIAWLNQRSHFLNEHETMRVATAALADRHVDHFEAVMARADGAAFPVALSWRWIDLEGDEAIVASFMDLTDWKQAEAELERSREALHQSEKLTALGSLLAGVSHELNNPLSVVVAQSVMMEEDAEGTRLASRAAKIRTAADRCAKIVATFLAMARQKRPERRSVDVNAVVRGALELTGYSLRGTGVAVTCALADGLPPVEADADQLHQVLANLIVNAQQALEEVDRERRLSVVTRRGRLSGTVEVEVADNGPGVPEEFRRRVLEPFFTTKPQGAGTGLGLSFSHGVVVAHGGTLEVLETRGGAAFRVTLPASGADAQTPGEVVASLRPEGDHPRGHALIVDDEPDIADTLAEILEAHGYRVRIAGDGAEAKRQLATREFDLVLSDLRMPGMDGPALHAWMKLERPRLLNRLGFVTGDTMGPGAVRFLEASGRPSLAKPFTPQAVRDLVARVRSGTDAP